MSVLHVVSVSGGKDSTALYLWAIDKFGRDGFKAVFADTGHEHPVTLNYVRNLHEMAKGPKVEWVKADFSDKVRAKGLDPQNSPFIDMWLWKGRAPSAQAQFCTEHVKLRPIKAWLEKIRGDDEVIMYTGIRAGESERRSKMPEREWAPLYDCYTERPLLKWTVEQVFALLKEKGVPPNPLYLNGFGRVGCYPCIHARKSELMRIEEWAWEKLAGRTWFSFGEFPLSHEQEQAYLAAKIAGPDALAKFKNENSPTVAQAREWARTSRGGRQFDLFSEDAKDVPSCMSTWGACE